MPYSWLLRSSVLSIFFVAIHGQCTTCGDCDADASACNADPACRVLVAGAIAEGEPPQICVEIGTCESNCALCSNADCEAASRARCFISGATNTCVGGDCQLSCTECTLGDGTDCDTSEAEPNGCVFDVEGAEECSPRPTDEPTTAAPTTAAPTTASPTTSAPTTASPTTLAPTTSSPTTSSPTTASPTTASPTTLAPTTATPTTRAPTTGQPTTMFPTDADDEPNSTEVDDCPECAYSVTVTYIGNVSLESCPTPSPTPQKSYWEKKETTQKKKKKSSKKKKRRRRRRQRRRRLGGGGGWKRDKEWDEEDDEPTPAPTPWIVDRDCIDRTSSRRRRRLKTWGYAADDRDDDGCNKKTKKTTTTPAPTTVDTEFEEWYREKCKLSSDAGWDEYFGDTAYGESTSSLSAVGANVYSRYATYADIEYGADVFLATVCVTYDIANVVENENDETDECPDPAAVSSIFLGLCENNATDFNSSTVSVEELSSLIVSVDADGGEIESAEGGSYEGQLGILIELSANNSATSIELCLGNVTVDDDFNDARESLENGYGVVTTGDNEVCPVAGLPCLNFFFDVPCPPNNTVVNSSEAVLNDDETVGADNAVSNGVSIFETPLVALENIDPYVRYSLLAVLVTFVVLTCIGCYICVVKRGERAHDGEKLVASDNETHVQLAQVPDDRDSQRFLQNTSTLDEENDDDHNFYDAQDLKSMATR